MDIREYTDYQEDEILRLYGAVGWKAYTADPGALRRGFENSLAVLAAYEGDELLGIIRAVGDGATVVLVQDLLVSPSRQRMGIGSALVRALLDKYPAVRQIQLVTDDTEKTAAFYRAAGFRPLEELACRGFMRFGTTRP